MICTITWNSLTLPEWQAKFEEIRFSTILQSYAYAKSQFIVNKQKPKIGIIQIAGSPAGLVQLMEVSLFKNIIHAMIVDRGPLWFEGCGSVEHFSAFTAELDRQFPKRFGRRRRFIPEIEDSPKVRTILRENGFTPASEGTYETIWLDLTQGAEDLRQNLKKNWRGALKKAEKNDVTLEWDSAGAHLPWLLQEYKLDKIAKGYAGPSVKLMRALAQTFTPGGNLLIGRAISKGKPIGAVLILRHGCGATYQIGWSNLAGRDLGAHYLLLWDALGMLQKRGVKDFDLGGVNEEEAKGVKKFKSGMGGRLVRLPGMYH